MRRLLASVAAGVVAVTTVLILVAPTPSAAQVDPTVKRDAFLKSGETFTHKSTQPMFGASGANTLLRAGVQVTPAGCRTNPALGQTCDAFRIEIPFDPAKRAVNFVYFTLEFDQTRPPDVVAVVTGFNPPPVGDLNVYFWETAATSLGFGPGGATANSPERSGFTPTVKAFDVTVQAMNGTSNGYTLRVTFSDEKFAAPFELLDDIFEDAEESGAAADDSDFTDGSAFTPDFGDTSDASVGLITESPLALAPIINDSAISGIGFNIDDQLSGPLVDLSGPRTRQLAAVGPAPSGATLALSLVLLPLAFAVGIFLWLRRRRAALIA